jgi:hypothetical protein
MPGIKALRKLQLGRESTAGTAVAATTIWRGLGTLEDTTEVIFPEEDIGYLSGVDRSYIPKVEGQLELESVEASFEQFPHILEMGVMTATPTTDGVGSGKIYTYNFPTTAAPTIKTYTIEGGDNQQEEEMAYVFCEEFTLEGNAEEAWMMSATLKGRQIAPSTFTGALSIPTVDDMLFQKSKLYIDAIGGTWGSTQKSNTLIAASLTYTTGVIAKYTADGNLYFSFIQYTQPEVKLNVTFEHDGTATAEKVLWLAQTPRLIQIKTEGSALTTPGTTYTFRTCLLNLAGKWESFDKIGEKDGNDIIEAEFRARYNSTGAKFGQIVVVNELASIP